MVLSGLVILPSQAQEQLLGVVNFLLTAYNRNRQPIQAVLQVVSYISAYLKTRVWRRLCCVNLLLKDTISTCVRESENTGGENPSKLSAASSVGRHQGKAADPHQQLCRRIWCIQDLRISCVSFFRIIN